MTKRRPRGRRPPEKLCRGVGVSLPEYLIVRANVVAKEQGLTRSKVLALAVGKGLAAVEARLRGRRTEGSGPSDATRSE